MTYRPHQIAPTLAEEEEKRFLARLSMIKADDPLDHRRGMIAEAAGFHSSQMISRQDLQSIAALQNILYEPIFTSHRKLAGPFIVFGKRLIYRFFKKWLGIMLARQFDMNQRVFNLAMAIHVLENRVKHLENSAKDRQ